MANLTATPIFDDGFDSSDEPEKYDFFRFLSKSKCPMIRKRDSNAAADALLFITPEQAKAALALLAFGYEDKAGSGWGPAERNLAGCVLTKKAKNPAKGHVEISPVVEGQPGIKPQAAHRLVVVAHKSREDVENMVARDLASHLCGQSNCINPQHIIVESKNAYIKRMYCERRSPTVHLVIATFTYVVGPRKVCRCGGQKCISMIEKCYTPSVRWLAAGG